MFIENWSISFILFYGCFSKTETNTSLKKLYMRDIEIDGITSWAKLFIQSDHPNKSIARSDSV